MALKKQLLEEMKTQDEPKKSTRLRFKDYVEQWLARAGKRIQPSTIDRYTNEIAHAVVSLGNYYVDAISVGDIQDWGDSMDCSASTANSRLRTLRVALEPLVDECILTQNPARKTKALKEGRTRGRRGTAYNAEELGKFMAMTRTMMQAKTISEDVGRMILVIALSGIRRGEAVALTWEDWRNEELHIVRAVWRREEGPTKTDDPRMIAAIGMLAQVLREQRAWLDTVEHPGRRSGVIFPASPRHARAGATRRGSNEVSWYRGPSTLDSPLRRVAQAAELPEVSAHSFRRSFENLLRKSGVDDVVRRSLAGWRTDTAQAIYAGIDASERVEAAERLERLLTKEQRLPETVSLGKKRGVTVCVGEPTVEN